MDFISSRILAEQNLRLHSVRRSEQWSALGCAQEGCEIWAPSKTILDAVKGFSCYSFHSHIPASHPEP